MSHDTWNSRDYLVLREVIRRADLNPRGLSVSIREIASATELSEHDVERAASALAQENLVTVDHRETGIAGFTGTLPGARERAGVWPTAEVAAERLLAALEASIEHAPTLEERSRRKQIFDGMKSGGKDFLINILAAVLTGQLMR